MTSTHEEGKTNRASTLGKREYRKPLGKGRSGKIVTDRGFRG